MPRDLEFWYALTPLFRALVGITLTLLLMTLCWWGVIYPIETEQNALDQQRDAQQLTTQIRWKTLLKLKPPLREPGPHDEAKKTFSPLALQSAGRQLIRWQPGARGGEIELEAQWEQIPQTFTYLAERNMWVTAFSLVMKENRLHFTLQLEQGDGG